MFVLFSTRLNDAIVRELD